jgi:hypothetical protein
MNMPPMEAYFRLAGQVHHAYFEARFPRSIEQVCIGYDSRSATKMIWVKFANGHVAEGPEAQARTDFFIAKCIMLHDLPMLPPEN